VALRWTPLAYSDLRRLHSFLEPVDARAAVRAVQLIITRAERITEQPRLGERLIRFGDREVRRVVVENYEIRYELRQTDIILLRVFHTREDR
jgi:plasmid stabilization system protein ParE